MKVRHFLTSKNYEECLRWIDILEQYPNLTEADVEATFF